MPIGETSQGPNSSTQKPTEVWLCLRFTHLSLNALGHSYSVDTQTSGQSSSVDKALAITYQNAIWQCNLTAKRNGVETGMSINHALILNPNLFLLERDPKAETEKLNELSFWAYRFTSLVSSQKKHYLILEVGKSCKLFNNLDHLLNLITSDLKSFNINTLIGVGLSPKAAHVLSHSNHKTLHNHQERLSLSSLSVLDLDKKIIQKFFNCGFNFLGDLSNIPKAELGARFGKGTLLYLDQLFNRIADPQIAITPPETFHACVNFAEPIHNITWIQQQLERLVNDLVQFINIRQLVCRSFTWRFFNDGKNNCDVNKRLLKTITIGVNTGQNIANVFKELTDLKLENIKLDWEFTSIELSSTQLYPMQLYNDDLFDQKPNQEQFNQLIDKLSSRLGHTALFKVKSENQHLPELANGRRDANQKINEQTTAPPYNIKKKEPFKDEPLWLLEKPKRLPKFNNQVNLEGPLNLIHGPNRITSHWWSKLQSRDYFIARQRNGRLIWIFFDRSQKQWYLQGLFA